MGLILPYSDRSHEDDVRRAAAWKAYQQSLDSAGFDPSEPVYRYFVGEAFHDSPIQISITLDYDAPDVTFNMRNIRLLDDLQHRYKVDIERPDFHCDVTFVKCHRFQFNLDLSEQQWFHQSAINRVNGLIEVVIAVSGNQNDDDEYDECIRLLAEDVQVEDITQRLSDRYGIDREEIEELMIEWHRGY